MTKMESFEKLWAERHGVPAESMAQYRFESREGYRLPAMAAHFRTHCDTLDYAEEQHRRDIQMEISGAPNVVQIQALAGRTEFVLPDEQFSAFGALVEANPMANNKKLQDFLARKSQFED